jgi:hypothetical protein
MMAPGARTGFPFPIVTGMIWAGSDYTADQATVCGSGTRYPVGMTLQQMARLYWRAKVYKLTVSCAASNYSVTAFETAFTDLTWAELDTPSDNLEYYQIGQGEDTPQGYPEDQPDNDVPWVLVLPVYQVNNTDPIAGFEVTLESPPLGIAVMTEGAPAWMLRLFEYGALVVDGVYYPSIELTLVPSVDNGGQCGRVDMICTYVPPA